MRLLLSVLFAVLLACPQNGPEAATLTLVQFRQRDQRVENGLLKEFEAATDIRVEQRIMPASSDLQHQQYVTWLAARDRSVDVYAVPRFTESGLLYYRKDLAPAPPRTWQELRQLALAKKRLLFMANPLKQHPIGPEEVPGCSGRAKDAGGRPTRPRRNDG